MLLASFRGVFRLLALVMLADPTEQVIGNLVLRVGIMFPVSDDPGSVLVRRVECLGPDSVGMHPGIAFRAPVRIIVIAGLKLVHEFAGQLLLQVVRALVHDIVVVGRESAVLDAHGPVIGYRLLQELEAAVLDHVPVALGRAMLASKVPRVRRASLAFLTSVAVRDHGEFSHFEEGLLLDGGLEGPIDG